MIEIKIPKEINDYKEKFLFGLTIRQFIFLVAALAICVPLYIFGKDYLGDDVVSWLIIIIAIPILAFGFFRYEGLPFEKFVAMIYRQKWQEPQKRKYIDLPVFYYVRNEIIEDKIAHQQEQIRRNKHNKESKRNGKKDERQFSESD